VKTPENRLLSSKIGERRTGPRPRAQGCDITVSSGGDDTDFRTLHTTVQTTHYLRFWRTEDGRRFSRGKIDRFAAASISRSPGRNQLPGVSGKAWHITWGDRPNYTTVAAAYLPDTSPTTHCHVTDQKGLRWYKPASSWSFAWTRASFRNRIFRNGNFRKKVFRKLLSPAIDFPKVNFFEIWRGCGKRIFRKQVFSAKFFRITFLQNVEYLVLK
jgi:hypothetical protein